MSNSSLVSYTNLSPHHSGARNHKLDRITPHCIVGQWSAKQGCDYFKTTTRSASANYIMGKNGEVGLCVEEKNRAWTSSSSANDNRAVTIETASDTTSPYKITDAAYNGLIKLMADICRRNGKNKILWFADKNTRINYAPKSNEMVITLHRDFASTSCPGDYMYSHMGDIANKVNALLGSGAAITPTVSVDPAAKGYLMKGDTGSAVKTMQTMLIKCGYSCGASGVDGSFGDATLAALKAFQKSNGLEVDGYYGSKSKAALTAKYNSLTATSTPAPAPAPAPTKVKVAENGVWDSALTKRLQQIFGTTVDGVVSNQWKVYKSKNPGLTTGWDWHDKPNGKGSQLIKAMQKWAGLSGSSVDGEIGSQTIKAIQIRLGCRIVDGNLSNPSNCIKALQKWANAQ